MELETIEMPPSEAALKLAAAELQIKRYRTPQPRLEALRTGYAALEKGQKLIELGPTIGAGGWDEEGRPRLAVCRSDRARVRFQLSHNARWAGNRASVRFVSLASDQAENVWQDGNPGPTLKRSVSFRHFAKERVTGKDTGLAVVPLVPSDALERAKNPDLKKCFTVFEADWEDVPVDPALLRHIGGDLYAVLATWNLTSLEQAVLREFSVDR